MKYIEGTDNLMLSFDDSIIPIGVPFLIVSMNNLINVLNNFIYNIIGSLG